MATKLATTVIYLDRLLIIKSYKALFMWSCKEPWQTRTIISLLQECLWQTNLGERSLSLMDSYNAIWNFDNVILWDTRFTYRRRFSTQMLKSSPPTCLSFYIVIIRILHRHQIWLIWLASSAIVLLKTRYPYSHNDNLINPGIWSFVSRTH